MTPEQKVKRVRCRQAAWCPGLQRILGVTAVRVSTILSTDTGKTWSVVVLEGNGRKGQGGATLNYCPFCGARINKAYYDHCMAESPAPSKRKAGGK